MGDKKTNSIGRHRGETTSNGSPDRVTHKVVNDIHRKREALAFQENMEKMMQGTLDVPAFLNAIAPNLIKELVTTSVETEDEKLKTSINQDLLDRAGYGKITKGAVLHQGAIDVSTTKRELVSAVLSLSKKAGIKIKGGHSEVEGDSDIVDVDVEPS